MNKPVKQLELEPANEPKANGTAAILAAAGLTPVQAAKVETILAEAGPCDDFDWNIPDDSIVVPPRPGVAVYRNRQNDVVVRVQNTNNPNDDGDHFAFIKPESLPAVIKALQDELP